ncbi:hypothetical protein QM012_004834 [Aureobasidium pullulans]|uniref:Uncharacterized protein n=1 Tax=Aureobasidium pullulans TaxID=5580 RepID=A0ABR0TVV6_AURPU
MFLSSSRKNNLTTYSKKAQRLQRSTLPSPTSYDRKSRRRRITLTSPVPTESLPASPDSLLLSSSAQSDHGDIEVQQVDTEPTRPSIQRRPGLPSLDYDPTALAVSPECIASPISSSWHDSISDDGLVPIGRGSHHTPKKSKPQPLSKLRKSLNTRPKKSKLVTKRPASVLSLETLRDIKRGADGFDEMHFVLLAVPSQGSMKRKLRSRTAALDLLKGPHPPVKFDDLNWLKVPYQHSLIREQEQPLQAVEATENESKRISEITRPKPEASRSPLMPLGRPPKKEVLLYAQLSSVSAPIMRRSSYDEESEDSYVNGFEDEEDEECEEVSGHRTSDAEREEGTARGALSPSKSWVSETVTSTRP